MQAAQDREGDDLATCMLCWHCSGFLLRTLLSDALMRSGLIEVLDIGIEHALKLLLLQDEQVIETLATHTAEEALADGIGTWSMIGRFENFDATGLGYPREGHAKFALVIPDEILRPHTKGGGEPSLLCGPRVSGKARHTDVDHFSCLQEGVGEGEQRAEEQVSYGEKVTGPDRLRMGMQERLPRLSRWCCGAHSSPVLLNGALAT